MAVNLKSIVDTSEIVEILHNDREIYEGKEFLRIRQVPHFIVSGMRGIAEQINPVPPLSVVASCCISEGLKSLKKRSEVKRLLELYTLIYTDIMYDAIDVDYYEDLTAWLSHYQMSVPNISMGQANDQAYRLPEVLKAELVKISDAMGMAQTSLALICIVSALSNQSQIHESRRFSMLDMVSVFMAQAERRNDFAEAMLGVVLDRP